MFRIMMALFNLTLNSCVGPFLYNESGLFCPLTLTVIDQSVGRFSVSHAYLR